MYRSVLSQRVVLILVLSLLFQPLVFAQQRTGALHGQVLDELGAVIVGATVTVTDANGAIKTATTNDEGQYTVAGLPPGRYTVMVIAQGFNPYQNDAVEIGPGQRVELNVKLSVSLAQQQVNVTAEAPISTEPENNAGAIVLRGQDLESLPDDPDELAEALQALAGPAAGPNGGQIFVDGFLGGRLPPKESIREIRINQNPFSAEFDRLGFGRIEILTKPGTDHLRGQAFFNFNDESLNARNPFAQNRPPYQRRQYGGNVSGPLIAKRASYFFDFERREIDDNEVINATVLDPTTLAPTLFAQSLLAPQRRTTFSPRIDYQLNQSNTLVARYTFEQASSKNRGIGGFSLPSRAFTSENTEHTLQLTETAVINQKVVNETRFQFIREDQRQLGDNSVPTINVLGSFIGGGSQVGQASNVQNRWELQNYTSWAWGRHALKAGAQIRHVMIDDISPQNFGGTFTFTGGFGPELDANNQIVLGPDGQPVIVPISSLEQYRRTLLFQRLGYTPAQIRALGGGASQFTLSAGNPEASVSQTTLGAFIQDDWRVRPDLTLSFGLRYENQTNIHDNLNFAPRFSFAWAPGAGGGNQRARTVIRGGFGIFYDRIGENLVLQARRFNGVNQQQYIVRNPDFYPNVPPITDLTSARVQTAVWRVADDIEAPYTMQAAIGVERQLTNSLTLVVNYIGTRTLHLLRARNINAPLPGSGLRPFGDVGNIFEYESSGRLNQNQLFVNLQKRFGRSVSFFASYIFGKAMSDTDGAGSFPANQYDLSGEYGRASFDIRHQFRFFGNFTLPWNVRVSPFVIIRSGLPFNITTGRDTNGDTLFTERPAFATDLSRPSVRITPYGAFDLNPLPGQPIIPRNYGEGPAFYTVNLRLSKTFGFGSAPETAQNGAGQGGEPRGGERRGGGGRGGGRFGGPFGGMGGVFGGEGTEKRYNLTFSVFISNLLNTNNKGTPIGNLSSPLFGQSNSSAGGFGFGPGGGPGGARRVELQVRFSF
jgi:hypothetical protein